MLNKCLFIGNVGADPEIRTTQAGKRIANLRLAVTEKWRDSNGERKERTEWVSVVCFNEGLCNVVEQYVKKGSKIYVEGQLQTRKWQDQSGNDRYSTEVVLQGFGGTLTLLDSPSSDRQPRQHSSHESGYGKQPADYNPDDPNEFPF